MKIRTLRMSGSRIQADVGIGTADNGSYVTVALVLDRKAEGVDDALLALENLLLREAEIKVGQAKDNAALQAKIDAKLPKAVAREKERLAKNAEVEVEKRTKAAHDATARVESELRSAKAQLQRVAEDANHFQTRASKAEARATDAERALREQANQQEGT